MQVAASAKNGEIRRILEVKIKIFEDSRIIIINIPPKKVLPTSPIKIFAGYQFKIKKANKHPAIGINCKFDVILIQTKIIKQQQVAKPSRPSIKLVKFIKPVSEIKIKIEKIKNSMRLRSLEKI